MMSLCDRVSIIHVLIGVDSEQYAKLGGGYNYAMQLCSVFTLTFAKLFISLKLGLNRRRHRC